MSDYYRDSLRTKEEELRIANDLIDLKDGWLRSLNEKLERLEKENERLEKELEDREQSHIELHCEKKEFKAERDTLIEENRRLEKLNEALKFSESMLWRSSRDFELERDELEKENEALRLQADTYFEKWQEELTRLGGSD